MTRTLWLLACLLLSTSVLAQVKPVRRVLIFYEYGLSSPTVSLVDQQLRGVLENSPYQIELYRVSAADTELGHGELGGYLDSFATEGKMAGGIAARILSGENPQNIPIVKDANAYLFDWKALHRWGLHASNLPLGSVVVNQQPSFWEPYRRYLLAGIFLLLAETAILVVLFWQWARRKRAQEALALANARLRLAMEAAKAVGWHMDIKTGRNLWFGALHSMLGIQSDMSSSQTGDFLRYLHPEDRQRVSQAVDRARQGHEPFDDEFRVIGSDGASRWVASRGKFEYHANGEAKHMMGMAVDITERKQAEVALSSVSRKLIEAHEEERTWVARELHDDINQRLAFLAVTLDVVKRGLPASADEPRRRITALKVQVTELGNDVQALSHRLHSSKLEYLGLASAASAFCREFSEHQGVQIDFLCDVIPKTLPQETSLCLFRVLQEALQNATKHSGSRHFQVSLKCSLHEINLTVSDSGSGFNSEEPSKSPGLGITSMRERLKIVKGELSIDSQPQKGTTVHASVPISSETKAARAGAS